MNLNMMHQVDSDVIVWRHRKAQEADARAIYGYYINILGVML